MSSHGFEAAGRGVGGDRPLAFWDVIRVDVADMFAETGTPKPPNCLLMLQDIRTFHGSQAKRCGLIVASPPCTEYSWMAMPWSRAKQVSRALRGADEFPTNYRGSRTVEQLNELFNACFRIQREASEAAGRHIPLVVENVRGAQPWVGRARANFGSYYLWGDVPALMPVTPRRMRHKSREGEQWNINRKNFTGTLGWDEAPRDDDGRKLPGFRFDGSGRSFQTAAVNEHMKTNGGIPHIRDGHPHTKHLTNPAEHVKRPGHDDWSRFGRTGEKSKQWNEGSPGSPKRKAASAKIAKIPFTLAHHIGRVWLPLESAA